jgi:CheY-like chemotaxis protein
VNEHLSGRALVVDDEESIRLVTSTMCERIGLTADTAASGEEALELFRASPGGYLVVLLDLTLPGITGAEVLEEIRKTNQILPVLLVSGYSEDEARSRHRLTGPTGFLQKPFTTADLRTRIGAALGS